jgi:hypothetical protein
MKTNRDADRIVIVAPTDYDLVIYPLIITADATPAYPANSPYMIASEGPEQNTLEAAV